MFSSSLSGACRRRRPRREGGRDRVKETSVVAVCCGYSFSLYWQTGEGREGRAALPLLLLLLLSSNTGERVQ